MACKKRKMADGGKVPPKKQPNWSENETVRGNLPKKSLPAGPAPGPVKNFKSMVEQRKAELDKYADGGCVKPNGKYR